MGTLALGTEQFGAPCTLPCFVHLAQSDRDGGRGLSRPGVGEAASGEGVEDKNERGGRGVGAERPWRGATLPLQVY